MPRYSLWRLIQFTGILGIDLVAGRDNTPVLNHLIDNKVSNHFKSNLNYTNLHNYSTLNQIHDTLSSGNVQRDPNVDSDLL